MVIEFLREFIGQPPEVISIINLPSIIEYISAVCILIAIVSLIINSVFSLMKIFQKGR